MVPSENSPVPGSPNTPAINKVPPEVLTEIFKTACFPSNILNSLPFEPVIITLSAICSRWRQLIWGTPSLWAVLEVDFRIWGPSMVGRIQTFLERSGTAPLRLQITFGRSSQAYKEALDLLISSSERWTSLSLIITHRLPSAFPSIRGRLDALEKLKLSYVVFSSAQLKSSTQFKTLFADVFSVAPSLHSLEVEQQAGGRDCTLPHASLPWGDLKVLILRQIRVEEDLLALSMCPNADQVEVDYSRRHVSTSASLPESFVPMAIVTNTTQFSANPATAEDVVELFSRCRFPMLHHLDLAKCTKTRTDLWDITSVKDLLIRSACALTSLSLWYLPVSDSDVMTLLDLTPTLEVLRISESVPMHSERRYGSEDNDFEMNNVVSQAFLRRLTVSGGEDSRQTADVSIPAHSRAFLPYLKDIFLDIYLVGLDQNALRDTIASRTCLRTVAIRLRMREDLPNLNSARLLEEELRNAGLGVGLEVTVRRTDPKSPVGSGVRRTPLRSEFEIGINCDGLLTGHSLRTTTTVVFLNMSPPQTPRVTRSSVLGKRSHQRDGSSSSCEQLHTPDTPTNKRIRISTTVVDGDANKENIPPYNISPLSTDGSPVSPRATRSLRRNATETMITPTRPRIASMRRASTSNELAPTTPATAISQLSLATPPPTPPVLLPIHARVRTLLRSTCNDIHELPGREKERSAITEFIHTFLGICDTQNDFSTLFVSGAPGTGKTALVNSIIQSLDQELHGVRTITLNCMALGGMDALWDRLVEDLRALQKGRYKKLKGREGVESLLSGLKTKCVIVLDELDHIASTSQSLSQLFSLTTSHGGVLRIIGIANTHTLTSSNVAPSSDVQTIHFAPYTSAQLQDILQSRLSSLKSTESAEAFQKFLPNPTITLLSKKVASLTGDVRALLEVLRGAIDLAVKSKTTSVDDALAASSHKVTPTHILDALKAYKPSSASSPNVNTPSSPSTSNSEIVTKTRALSVQARLTLLTVLLASKRVEAELSLTSSSSPSPSRKHSHSSASKDLSFDMAQLHAFYGVVLTRESDSVYSTVSRTEFGDLLGMLEGVGLLSLGAASPGSPTKAKSGKRGFGKTSSFNAIAARTGDVKLNAGVWTDEVLRGLGVGLDTQDVKEEEINAIWVRESARIAKDVKIARSKERKEECGVGFSDAVEDT
ncbi:AAA ATPase [Marasmius crinis-equi]|uniref:AAA ATPase n=1 Tax=Marasmius crinis-equi TaxID=585013 RepID=A0ABR3FLN1_9AGAR